MIGRTLSHYEVIARLGQGGMGTVYRARDTSLGREVALKVLPAEMATDTAWLERFKREAQAVARLNHPGIVTIHSIEEADGVHFSTMELVEGRSIDQVLPAFGFEIETTLELAVQIVGAVAAAHEAGIVHRDLKPANIMIGAGNRTKVLDFGLAKMAPMQSEDEETQLLTQAGTVLGTVPYMSPEQLSGKAVDQRSDVFSLGIVLYEMITGGRPFQGSNRAEILSSVLRDTPEPPSAIRTDTPADLERIIERCLRKDPAQRYADAIALRDELEALRVDSWVGQETEQPPTLGHSKAFLGGLAAVVAVAIIGGGWWLQRQSHIQDQLVQLERTVDGIQFLQEGPESWQAWRQASKIERAAPGDPRLERLWPKFTSLVDITSEPDGANVSVQYYGSPEEPWVEIGRTPLRNLRYPKGFSRIRVEKPGRRPAHDLIWAFEDLMGASWHFDLLTPESIPDSMEFVPGGTLPVFLPGLDDLEAIPLAPFLMDRHEVTNREYAEFVDAGGYQNPDYWTEPFIDDRELLTWEQVLPRFVDRTGQPGPASWEVGTYPSGRENDPVTGVSWFEAAAFANWADKTLPTVFHWNFVAFTPASSQIVPFSNFADQGPRPVASGDSVNRYGVHDLAGNVREWVSNASSRRGERFILGGGWSDPPYGFVDAYAQSAFDRSQINGFRTIRQLGDEPNMAQLVRTLEVPFRDFLNEPIASDDEFTLYLKQFDYDPLQLRATLEEEIEVPFGRRQKVSFDAAYGGERMMAYLFLPEHGRPPYQVALVFPGSGALHARSSTSLRLDRSEFILKSGRAVVYPILKGTYERGGGLGSDYPTPSVQYKDHVIAWGKDIARTIDYLETLDTINTDKLAYFGLSWGGAMGAIIPAVESRIQANILYVAGLNFQQALPEVDQINYITRVSQPTLMLNGELDFYFPVETSQRPMFELLGTPEADKKWLIHPAGHSVPRLEMIRESLAWLDRYLGPVDQP